MAEGYVLRQCSLLGISAGNLLITLFMLSTGLNTSLNCRSNFTELVVRKYYIETLFVKPSLFAKQTSSIGYKLQYSLAGNPLLLSRIVGTNFAVWQ